MIALQYPPKLVFGSGSISVFIEDFLKSGYRRLFLIAAPQIMVWLEPRLQKLTENKVAITIFSRIESEPTIELFNTAIEAAREFYADSVAGIGGGSVLDMAKLIASQLDNSQTIREIFGIGNLHRRKTYLACLPTTSGTGSEVSPNAILLDESDNLKKGVISPYLVPDAAYIDPQLTLSVPPTMTVTTGLDAMIHCIEAYTNRFAHPFINHFAIKGIELIASNIGTAYRDGHNLAAREALSLGSLYGGFCLGPVNTAAVHALSYPLGGEFHIPHGLANALLLPYVMMFNIETVPTKYADVASALGVKEGASATEIARNGILKIFQLYKELGVPTKLAELNIPREALDRMAEIGMTVTRLLKNNPREMTLADAKKIYLQAY